MSQSQPSGAQGRGVMRFLAGGAGSSRFAAVFQFADAIFSPARQAAFQEREQQRRRKVAVPAPGDPPSDGEHDDLADEKHDDPAVAIPRPFLITEEPDDPQD